MGVQVDPDDEAAIEKIIVQAFFRGVNDNPFLAYITDETGRTQVKPSIQVINDLHLQFTAASRLDYKGSSGSKIKKAEPKKKNNQSQHCFSCYMRGHKSTACKNKPGGEYNLNGERTFKKPSWWNSKLSHPALSKNTEKKKVKKLKEDELEEAAHENENEGENNDGENFSEEDSEGEVVDKKVKKATSKQKKGIHTIRVNIKKTQEHQSVTAYYKYDVKVNGKKARRQKIFNDSGSGLDTVGEKKVEKDGATLVKEVPEDLDVVDFNNNPVQIIGYAYYLISEPGRNKYKKKKFFVTPAVEDEELLVGLETMRAWGVIDENFPRPNPKSFDTSKENMDSIKLRIATIENSINSGRKLEEKTNHASSCLQEKHSNPSEENNDISPDTEEFEKHDQKENNFKTQEVAEHGQTREDETAKHDGMINNLVNTETHDTTSPDTQVTKTDDTTTSSNDNNKETQEHWITKPGNMKKKQNTQSKYKQMSELKMLAKARRRVATLERRKAQKEYHFLAKKLEKINTTIEEECKAIQEELLTEYEDVFSAKLTRDQRIKCQPVKLELVKNSDDLPKPNQLNQTEPNSTH